MQERKPLQGNAQTKKLTLKIDIVSSEKPALSAEEQKRLNDKLVRAAMDNNRSEILRLIKAGADIAARNKDDRTVLHVAATNSNPKNCDLLLEEYVKASGDVKKLITSKDR